MHVQVWIYRDKATGQPKGDGTVTYEDPFTAGSAVSWFSGKEFKGEQCCGGGVRLQQSDAQPGASSRLLSWMACPAAVTLLVRCPSCCEQTAAGA